MFIKRPHYRPHKTQLYLDIIWNNFDNIFLKQLVKFRVLLFHAILQTFMLFCEGLIELYVTFNLPSITGALFTSILSKIFKFLKFA